MPIHVFFTFRCVVMGVVLGSVLLMSQKAEALSVVWQHPPQLLIRGRHFVWQGQLKGVSPTLLKRGVRISFALLLPSRTISLGQVPVNNQGHFLFEGVVSHRLSPQPYRLDVRILVPQAHPSSPFRPSRQISPARPAKSEAVSHVRTPGAVPRPRHTPEDPQRSEKSEDPQRSGKSEDPQRSEKSGDPQRSEKSGDPQRSEKSGDAQRSGKPGDAQRSGKSEDAQRSGKSDEALSNQTSQEGSFRATETAKEQAQRKQRLLEELKKGWKVEQERKAQDRLHSEVGKAGSFLLPPIQPEGSSASWARQPGTKTGGTSSKRAEDANPAPLSASPSLVPPALSSISSSRGQPEKRTQVASPEQKSSVGDGSSKEIGASLSPQGSQDSTLNQQNGRREPQRQGQIRRGGAPGSSSAHGQGSVEDSQRSQIPSSKGHEPAEDSQPAQPEPPRDLPPTMVPSVRSPSSSRLPKSPVHSNRDSLVWNRSLASSLDYNTDMGHTYLRQVFEPYIPHLQRISVLQRVLPDFSLSQEDGPKSRIVVGGQRNSQRSYFVGRIRVVLWRKRWTPIPSVSPEARILWVRTQPSVMLEFAKDAGDLFYVRAKRWNTAITFLEFGTDGSRDYFGGSIPEDVWSSQYAEHVQPRVPVGVRRVVLRHLRQFGLEPDMALHEVLYKIVPYLRSFVARKLQSHEYQDNAFSTLWLSRVGVCRHRATLFVMALQSLGFPARMVANQAHAFAEVQYPNRQWRQIDLGGGEIPHWMGSWRGQRYQTPQDPFPEPPPNPHRRKEMPSTPHPPPHDPSSPMPDRRTEQGHVSPGVGHSSQAATQKRGGKGSSPARVQRLLPSQLRRKMRKPYIPHTRF